MRGFRVGFLLPIGLFLGVNMERCARLHWLVGKRDLRSKTPLTYDLPQYLKFLAISSSLWQKGRKRAGTKRSHKLKNRFLLSWVPVKLMKCVSGRSRALSNGHGLLP